MVICGSPSPIWLDLVGADWEFTELKLWKTFDFAPVPASPDLTHREQQRRARSKQFHINLLGAPAARWFNSS
jgi:hypothetical protein